MDRKPNWRTSQNSPSNCLFRPLLRTTTLTSRPSILTSRWSTITKPDTGTCLLWTFPWSVQWSPTALTWAVTWTSKARWTLPLGKATLTLRSISTAREGTQPVSRKSSALKCVSCFFRWVSETCWTDKLVSQIKYFWSLLDSWSKSFPALLSAHLIILSTIVIYDSRVVLIKEAVTLSL